MAGPSTREASPWGRDAAEANGTVTVLAIVILLAVGLALRLIIAYGLLPGSGFPNDLSTFQAWGNDLAAHGPVGFYDRQSFIDYPPVYLLFLGLVGIFNGSSISQDGVKLIPILADVALAVVVWQMVLELGASQRRAIVAMIVVLVNPVTWFNSSIWGQADSVGCIFLLLSVLQLQRDKREAASVFAVLATLTKLQLGIVGFVVAFVVLRRSLFPRTGPAEPTRILSSIGAGLLTAALVCLPFTGLELSGLVHRLTTVPGLLTFIAGAIAAVGVFFLARRILAGYGTPNEFAISIGLAAATLVGFSAMVFDSIVTHLVSTFGEYPYLTLNAYNPWALVSDAAGNAMASGLNWIQDSPWTDQSGQAMPGFRVGPFPPATLIVVVGLAIILAAVAFGTWTMSHTQAAALDEGDSTDDDGNAAPDEAASDATVSAGGRWTPAGVAARALGGARDEIRGLPAICIVVAGLLCYLLVAQIAGGMTAAVFGDGLLVITIVGVSIWAARRDDPRSLLVALAILSIAFFVAPTRVHERYLFPFFGLAAVLLAVSWRWSVAYVVLAVANTANLLAVLVEYQGIPTKDGNLGKTLTDWGNWMLHDARMSDVLVIVAACAVITGLAMIWALLQMRSRAVGGLAREALAAAGDGPQVEILAAMPLLNPAPATQSMSVSKYDSAQAAGSASRVGPEYEADYDYDYDFDDDGELDLESGRPRPQLVPPFVMRVWGWLYRRPDQPDRSMALDHEKRGRFDKLDVWILAALVVATLSLRIYRLDEPVKMHFDEVYHARTATEFLQEWQYGIPHDIYEWTHPHFAKYAIAAGITLFSDDKVNATSDLNVNVKDVAVEPRIMPASPADPNDPRTNPDARLGDRIFVATGSDVRSYDLETRALEYTYEIPGASALSLVGDTGVLYVGTSSGGIFRIDTTSLDDVRLGASKTPTAPAALPASTGISITHLYAGTPPIILAADAGGAVVSVDLDKGGGTVVAKGTVPGAADFVDFGTGPGAVSFTPSQLTDPGVEAKLLASAIPNSTEADIEAQLRAAVSTHPVPLSAGTIDSSVVTAIQTLITAGKLPGVSISAADPQVLVAYQQGVGVLDAQQVVIRSTLATSQPATSIAVPDDSNQPSFVAAGNSIVLITLDSSAGTVTLASPQPLSRMPGPVTKVSYDVATHIAQALGRTPDGKGWTLYSIDSTGDALGNNVFQDAPLPFQPVAIGLDSTPDQPSTDREQMLAFSADGSMASVDVGQFAFSWRIVGVLFGALMAVCLYLLARVLFRRRSVGLLVAFFSLVDGMFFVQSRIAMNDTYVGGFLILAYLIFALLWLGVWKNRFAFWLGMPLLGVVLGLALASKWVALYAIASIGFLVLVRSALGRLIAVLGLAGGTGVLGWLAIGEMTTQPNTGNLSAVVVLLMAAMIVAACGIWLAGRFRATPDKIVIVAGSLAVAAALAGASLLFTAETVQNGAPNYTFFLIMLGVTAIAAAANAYHPVAWTRQEFQFAVAGPIIVGAIVGVFGLALQHGFLSQWLSGWLTQFGGSFLKAGAAGLAAGPAFAVAFYFAGQMGFGPLAKPPAPSDLASLAEPPAPAPTGWLRLGSGFGLPAVWMVVSILIVPIAIYVALYIPWSMPWQPETAATGSLPAIACWHTNVASGLCDSAWPAGHTGQDLIELTKQMYTYHNDLRAAHAASSPWWAWPMDLKPVWFESIGYGPDTGSWIHDGGNPATWWVAIFGMAFICWQAFKRRSLGLTLIAVAFFWQWLSWARVDRASFQYHFYTALPFFLLALAYFAAEIWHGPSRKTWLLARFAAAAAFLFPAALWLFKAPLCSIARVDPTDTYGISICGTGTGDVVLQGRHILIGLVLIAALAVLAIVLLRAERRQIEGEESNSWIAQLVVPVLIAGALLWVIGQYGPTDVVFRTKLPSDTITLVMLCLGLIGAPLVLASRNPRRWVLGLCIFGVVVFGALYPDLSALPIPNAIQGPYQGILPTWFYGFQFSVNQQVSAGGVHAIGPESLSLVLVGMILAAIVGWAAWERRVIMGIRRHGADPALADPAPDTDATTDATTDAPSTGDDVP